MAWEGSWKDELRERVEAMEEERRSRPIVRR